MKLKALSSLIDPGTRIAKTMTTTGQDHRGRAEKCPSGYLAFVVDGKLQQRRIYDMAWNTKLQSAAYVVLKQIGYAIDLPCKPISGAFNVESLKL